MHFIEQKETEVNPIQRISSGGLILNTDKQVLLVYRRSTGEYLIPNGQVEKDESLEEAAIREVLEETGYSTKIVRAIDVAEYSYVWEDGKTYHKKEHHYLLTLDDHKRVRPKRLPHEDYTNKWMSLDIALNKATYPDARDCIVKIISSL